jgi:ribonucleoside-diphosphate reductase alpha chain
MERMCVVKRTGVRQEISFDKVLKRIRDLCEGDQPLRNVNYELIARKVINCINDGIKTSELDTIAAAIAQPMVTDNFEYGILATRLLISNHHKNCDQTLLDIFGEQTEIPRFLLTCQALWENIDINYAHSPMIAPHVYAFVRRYSPALESLLDYDRDYLFQYAGFDMILQSYLLRCSIPTYEGDSKEYRTTELIDGQRIITRTPIERPQHMWLRVALGIWLTYPDVPYREQIEKEPGLTWDLLLSSYDDQWCDKEFITKFKRIKDTYDILSNMYAMHATPTLFNSGTVTPQLSSCFLTTVAKDSLDSIYDYMKNVAMISKWAGGIGSHIHDIRPSGSYISGTGGTSNGIVPMIRNVNETSKYVDQGGGKRAGSHAIYIELWHGDIIEFIDLKKPHGNEEARARSLLYALWISDEFMRCVQEEERLYNAGKKVSLWYLMDSKKCPGLSDAFDSKLRLEWISDSELDSPDRLDGPDDLGHPDYAFTKLYRSYIKKKLYIKAVSARDIWTQICDITTSTGVPYKLFKDAINRKNNQSNLGTIKSSNLCTEIVEYSDATETAVCNLGSICLAKYVVYKKPTSADKYPFAEGFPINYDLPESVDIERVAWFDFEKMGSIVRTMIRNLDQVISQNYYPIPSARKSNMRHRPVGLGVQGLADCFTKLWLPYDSEQALKLDYYIHEVMNFEAKTASCDLAEELGHYETYIGSPMSEGKFTRDLWEQEYRDSDQKTMMDGDWNPCPYPRSQDWNSLAKRIAKHGQRNSLLLSNMPTASTSTITGMSSAFEPHNAMLYKRKDGQGENYVFNSDLQLTLMQRKLWSTEVRDGMFLSRVGGIQEILSIPKTIRDIFKGAYDMSPKISITHMLIRGTEIDQAQSMNLFVRSANHQLITQMLFYSWRRGGKNGCYYLRMLSAADAKKSQIQQKQPEGEICTMQEGCVMCSS